MKKKVYYRLPTDNYGQPDGNIQEVLLTKAEYLERKKTEWIYEKYIQAAYRAQD
jgi:hypothetical protein